MALTATGLRRASSRRAAPSLALLAALSVALTGCTYASQALSEADLSPDITVDAVPSIAALVPPAVAADGKLTVASELSYPPMEFVAADGVTPVGLDIDIITAVAKVLGLEVDIQSATFDSIIPAIGTRYEVGASSFTITPERLQAVNMVSYFEAGSLLAVQAGNPAGVDPANLCGLTVGVQTGTTQQDALNAATGECVANGAKPIEILTYTSGSDVTTNLVGGKVQAMFADSPVTAYAVEQTGGAIESLGDVQASAPYGIVVAKGDMELAAAIQAALQHLMDNGILAQLADHWGNASGAATTSEINPGANP